MFNASQFREMIVRPTLNMMQAWSANAEELLMFTCATESIGGSYLHQVNGPALGVYQMEPHTYHDIWLNFISPNSSKFLAFITNFSISSIPSEDRLIYDLRFATAMARIFFLRIPAPLPDSNDIEAIWTYYKQYYNTSNGAATKDHSISIYREFLHR